MPHNFRKEWEKLFGEKYHILKKKDVTMDGETEERLAEEDPETLNEMMTSDWSAFLDGSDVFSELSVEEQERIRKEGPRYNDYM